MLSLIAPFMVFSAANAGAPLSKIANPKPNPDSVTIRTLSSFGLGGLQYTEFAVTQR